VAVTPRALRGLLGYFHGHRGLGRWLEWSGPPNDPIAMLVPEQHVRAHRRWDWMLRILDVEAAFSGRGYPPIEAEATFAVFDPRYKANTGTFRLEVSGGRGSIARAPNAPDTPPVPIGTVSAMFTGHLRVHDAARLGALRHDDPAVPSLAAMLDGPAPWNPFWF
jgi:predicted acetyltransferase